MSDPIHVKGLSDLQTALDTLAAKVQDNIMRGALLAGAKVIAQKAKAICPVEGSGAFSKYKTSLGWTPGALQKSIRIGAKLTGGQVTATVKAGNKMAYYAHMVEGGTVAHWMKPKNGKSLFFAGIMRDAVYHPGSRKNPFFRIAYDSTSQAAVEKVGDYIRARLTKQGIEIPDDGNNTI